MQVIFYFIFGLGVGGGLVWVFLGWVDFLFEDVVLGGLR